MRTVNVDRYPEQPERNPSCHVNESLSPNPSNCVVLRGVVLWFFPADHRGEVQYNCITPVRLRIKSP